MGMLSSPALSAAHEYLRDRFRAGHPPSNAVVLVGRCRIDYHGRAASKLDRGDRVVLVKSDGTLLIHGPASVRPVNWQPPGARFDVESGEGHVTFWARRPKPVEVIEIRFERFDLCWDGPLVDEAPLQLSGTEFDLRDLLRDRPELVEPGFKPWERERITDQGPMDLYGEDAKGRRVVVEVKRVNAGIAEATQLWRYVEAERKRRSGEVRGILIAPRASPRALQLLQEHGLEFLARHWDDTASRTARARAAPSQPRLSSFSD